MTTKRIASATLRTSIAPSHRLDALLRTMRSITHYEDPLCELSHEVKGADALSDEARLELREMLEKIPAHDFMADLAAVMELLAEPPAPKRAVGTKAAKATKPTKATKGLKRATSSTTKTGSKAGSKAGRPSSR